METLVAVWLLAFADNAYKEITTEPPKPIVQKVTVPSELYYPDVADDMWDANWINKKV